jgi:CRP-like cAMP-binding protein
MVIVPPAPRTNRSGQDNLLLAALSEESGLLLRKHFHKHELRAGAVLWEPGASVNRVFFPIYGIITIHVPNNDGNAAEVASIGPEGAAGFTEMAGIFPVPTEAIMQTPGRLVAISAEVFATAARDVEEIRRAVELCNAWLLLQAQVLAACNAAHPADGRFCRWLLRASDALGRDTVPATQETIARALGVRRTTATLIAQHLHSRGIISYMRGRITIQDRAGLEAAACHCHRMLGRDRWPSELLRARPKRSATA